MKSDEDRPSGGRLPGAYGRWVRSRWRVRLGGQQGKKSTRGRVLFLSFSTATSYYYGPSFS
ncbi:hypothetical protein ABZV64_27795 [Streptomyces sp. NPDC004959]|uniref:hypothetical protein n=1 Tax=Streptomyces sp. NPDC004959 TaxID=3154673 RepID=UPI0033A7C4FE